MESGTVYFFLFAALWFGLSRLNPNPHTDTTLFVFLSADPAGGGLRQVLLVLPADDLRRGALALALHRQRDDERQGKAHAHALEAQGAN